MVCWGGLEGVFMKHRPLTALTLQKGGGVLELVFIVCFAMKGLQFGSSRCHNSGLWNFLDKCNWAVPITLYKSISILSIYVNVYRKSKTNNAHSFCHFQCSEKCRVRRFTYYQRFSEQGVAEAPRYQKGPQVSHSAEKPLLP